MSSPRPKVPARRAGSDVIEPAAARISGVGSLLVAGGTGHVGVAAAAIFPVRVRDRRAVQEG